MTHTPIPWKVTSKSIWDIRIQTQDGADIAKCDNTGDWIKKNNTLIGRSQNKLITDATFIVKACNAHDELVAALKDMTAILARIQNTLTGYLIPDSTLDQDECINEILNITDHENTLAKQRRALQALAKTEKGV